MNRTGRQKQLLHPSILAVSINITQITYLNKQLNTDLIMIMFPILEEQR